VFDTAVSIFITVAPSGAGGQVAWLVIVAILGVFLFLWGFRMLRYKRLILNTPFSKIRSASMGLVEVSGAAKGPRTIPAGVTGQACYYYCATAYQLRGSGKNRSWQSVASESLCVPFFVEDPTGRMLVNPEGAALDIDRNFKDEFDTSFFSKNRDMLPENVAKFLNRNNVSFSANTRVEEYCIKPACPLFVFGTLSTNSTAAQWTPNAHVPAANSPLVFQLSFFGGDAKRSLIGIGVSPISTMDPEYLASLASAAPAPPQIAPPRAPAPVVWSSVSMDDENLAGSPAGARTAPSQAKSPVATAEPDDDASDTTRDSAPSSAGFDLCPPAVICKVAHEPFMISTHSQREVVRSLAWKSALFIWGGAVLALTCLYLVAVIFELT
jgi:E3 Ubiquitin ligase